MVNNKKKHTHNEQRKRKKFMGIFFIKTVKNCFPPTENKNKCDDDGDMQKVQAEKRASELEWQPQ